MLKRYHSALRRQLTRPAYGKAGAIYEQVIARRLVELKPARGGAVILQAEVEQRAVVLRKGY
jgi:hypothetical protein